LISPGSFSAFFSTIVLVLSNHLGSKKGGIMFRKFLQASSPEIRFRTLEERDDLPAGPPAPVHNERNGSPVNTKLSTFEDIYDKSPFRPSTSTAAWDILKVADMINSEHLHGLSPVGKHSALMMALEAAGIAVEDMLQDAVQRQRVLNEYEEVQRGRLEEFEKTKLQENARLTEELDAVTSQYRVKIASVVQEIESERTLFREWQERKEKEQRRISEAASACVSVESGASDASISRLLEKKSGRVKELAQGATVLGSS
jgi:hypothetical protein